MLSIRTQPLSSHVGGLSARAQVGTRGISDLDFATAGGGRIPRRWWRYFFFFLEEERRELEPLEDFLELLEEERDVEVRVLPD